MLEGFFGGRMRVLMIAGRRFGGEMVSGVTIMRGFLRWRVRLKCCIRYYVISLPIYDHEAEYLSPVQHGL